MRLKNDKQVNLAIVAGSHHFSKVFGFTYKEILRDKNKINYTSPVKINKTSFEEVIKYCGKSMIIFSNL